MVLHAEHLYKLKFNTDKIVEQLPVYHFVQKGLTHITR